MPDYLIKEWERWDHKHKSENDHPSTVHTSCLLMCGFLVPLGIFGSDQLFILFESENGGTDLEHFEVCAEFFFYI